MQFWDMQLWGVDGHLIMAICFITSHILSPSIIYNLHACMIHTHTHNIYMSSCMQSLNYSRNVHSQIAVGISWRYWHTPAIGHAVNARIQSMLIFIESVHTRLLIHYKNACYIYVRILIIYCLWHSLFYCSAGNPPPDHPFHPTRQH